MMRFIFPVLLALLPALASSAAEPRHKPITSMSEEDVVRLTENPPYISQARLPAGYKIGRCQLIMNAQTRISGRCAYSIGKGGDFVINGPRQIYDGIDYPKADGMAAMVSTDYWASVFKDDDGTWTGYGNEDVRSVHGEGSNFGPMHREGACLVGKDVRVCLWKN